MEKFGIQLCKNTRIIDTRTVTREQYDMLKRTSFNIQNQGNTSKKVYSVRYLKNDIIMDRLPVTAQAYEQIQIIAGILEGKK